jgi:hypothetical protein
MKGTCLLLSLTTLVGLLLTTRPAPAQDAGSQVTLPGLFSYQAPSGWKVQDSPISRYPVAFDVPQNNFAANLNVVVQTYPDSLANYVAANRQQMSKAPVFTHFQIIDQQPFATANGAQGIRMVVKDGVGKQDLQQIFYFFEGAADRKFVVTASSLEGDGGRYAPIFDASLKTFQPQ